MFEWRKFVHYWWSYISFSPECKELTSMLDPLLYRWGVPPVVIRCVHWTMQMWVLLTRIIAQGLAIVMTWSSGDHTTDHHAPICPTPKQSGSVRVQERFLRGSRVYTGADLHGFNLRRPPFHSTGSLIYKYWPIGSRSLFLQVPQQNFSSQRTHDAIMMSLSRQNDVAMLFWRNNDVVIASCAHWVWTISAGLSRRGAAGPPVV